MLRPVLRVLVTALAVAAALAAGGEAEAPPGALPGFWPDPGETTSTLRPDGAWEAGSGGVRVVLVPLDDDARWEWLSANAGAGADPFSPRPGSESQYLSFVLAIANDSRGIVMFNPSRIWLQSDDVDIDIQRPLDLATIQAAWRHLDAEMPPAYEKAASGLLEGETLLHGGDVRQGLLVFRRPRGDPRSFTLSVPMTTGAGEPVELRAAYLEAERAERKRAKQEADSRSRKNKQKKEEAPP